MKYECVPQAHRRECLPKALIIIPANAECGAWRKEWQNPRNLVPLEVQTHRGRRKMLEGPAGIDYSPDTRPVPPRTVRWSMVGGS
jgi:hypothetical protein